MNWKMKIFPFLFRSLIFIQFVTVGSMHIESIERLSHFYVFILISVTFDVIMNKHLTLIPMCVHVILVQFGRFFFLLFTRCATMTQTACRWVWPLQHIVRVNENTPYALLILCQQKEDKCVRLNSTASLVFLSLHCSSYVNRLNDSFSSVSLESFMFYDMIDVCMN